MMDFKRKTICLNMIVKNESAVIRRCLDSVMPIIDSWVIVDTGSQDGTQSIIQSHMKVIPGTLYEREWKGFAASRSEALELARGKSDYILFMDADDFLEFDSDFQMPDLTCDVIQVWKYQGGMSYIWPLFISSKLPCKYVGIIHEYLEYDPSSTVQVLEGIRYRRTPEESLDQARKKYLWYIELLKEGLHLEPNNPRYAFYLATTYADVGDMAKALEWSQKRVRMGGWEEEVYLSKVRIAHILKEWGFARSVVRECYHDAFLYRPHRPEAVYHLVYDYNYMREYEKAYDLMRTYFDLPKPLIKDVLFNFDWIIDYGFDIEMTTSGYYVGQFAESLAACDRVLQRSDVPLAWREIVIRNRTFSASQMSLA